MPGAPDGYADLTVGWIQPRKLLTHRKWAPSSAAAIHVASEAITQSGWTDDELRNAVVFLGTSRGSVAGWLEAWPDRRPVNLLAASNSLSSEPAAAVSAEFGIHGPWQVISTGCCAGLDALGTAKLWIDAGMTERAIVVSVDLPLVTPILDAYASTGVLATEGQVGIYPAEGAACVCLEKNTGPTGCELTGYHASGEPNALVSSERSSESIKQLLLNAVNAHGMPDLIIPHQSGTAENLRVETEVINDVCGSDITMQPIKSLTGHCVAASGLLEMAMIIANNRPASVFKFASALGGRHSLAAFTIKE